MYHTLFLYYQCNETETIGSYFIRPQSLSPCCGSLTLCTHALIQAYLHVLSSRGNTEGKYICCRKFRVHSNKISPNLYRSKPFNDLLRSEKNFRTTDSILERKKISRIYVVNAYIYIRKLRSTDSTI
jgi:hypothetical protein